MRIVIVGRRPAALLLAVFAALALVACGGGTKTVTVESSGASTTRSAPPKAAPVPAKSSPAHPPSEAPARILRVANFLSPSGNIGCAIAGGIARCDIVKRSWSPPPRPSSCSSQVDFGQGIEIGKSGAATFVCAGDTARTPGAPKLPYGAGASVGRFVCVSREAGMTCTLATTGRGFTISVQGYKLF
ncbi:MAG: DUF6636 domain-containing protein [Solirubrobacteraceae bacterium]